MSKLNPELVALWRECQQEGATLFPDNADVAQSAAATLFIGHQKSYSSFSKPSAESVGTVSQPAAPAPAAPPSQAGTQVADGMVMSVSKREGAKDGKPWASYTILLDSGIKASTFRNENAKIAEQAAANAQRVRIVYKSNTNPRWAADLVGIQVLA